MGNLAAFLAGVSTSTEHRLFLFSGVNMERIGEEQKMTVKEVADAIGCKPDTVQKIARRLEEEGKIGRISIRADFKQGIYAN